MKIYKDNIDDELINAVVKKIKSKKELANYDGLLCIDRLVQILKQDKKIREKLASAESYSEIEKSKELKQLIKQCRKDIRGVYGAFVQKDIAKANELLDELKDELKKKDFQKTIEVHEKLLSLHTSAIERLPFYEEFYEKIFSITGKPNSVLDIACGFNPMSILFMHLGMHDLQYIAVEMNKDDVKLLNKYFKIIASKTNVKGEAMNIDLAKGSISKFEADICFSLKLFDLLDTKSTERLVKEAKCKWFIASFPTRTLSREHMRFKRRAGFQKMLRRLNLKYETITFENELVYVIKKE